jgi:hypothetical protein
MVARFSRRFPFFTTVWLRLSQCFCHRPGDDTDDVEQRGLRVPDDVKESLHDQDDVPGSLCTQDDVEGVPRQPGDVEEHHHEQGDVEGSPGEDKANVPKLRALLTGISYKQSPSNPDGSKWEELDGTYGDVEQFRTLLLGGYCFRSILASSLPTALIFIPETYKYLSKDIIVLKDDPDLPGDSQPTKANMVIEPYSPFCAHLFLTHTTAPRAKEARCRCETGRQVCLSLYVLLFLAPQSTHY